MNLFALVFGITSTFCDESCRCCLLIAITEAKVSDFRECKIYVLPAIWLGLIA